MEECLKWLDDNQWLNLIYLTLAILSIITSIYLYRKSRKRKKPVFAIRSTNVISDEVKNLGEVEVKFKGDKIDNLTVSKVAFWNSGNDTLNDDDQAPIDKVRIELKEGFVILESEVIFQSSETNNIHVNNKLNTVEIGFDYFDSNQGGIIKFVHTGKKSSDVTLKGTFKGSEKLKKINSRLNNLSIVMITIPLFGKIFSSRKEKRNLSKVMPWIVILTGVVLFSAYFLSESSNPDKLVLLIMGCIYTVLGLVIVFGRTSMPKGFEVFFDDE